MEILMNEERDKFLIEAMGLCWHNIVDNPSGQTMGICIKCKGLFHALHTSDWFPKAFNPDFSTWLGFGKLWEWTSKQEWWGDFWNWIYDKECDYYSHSTDGKEISQDYFWGKIFTGEFGKDKSLICPNRFANAIYEWWKEKHG